MKGPEYLFNNLKKACRETLKNKTKVIVTRKAMEDASFYFLIQNRTELLKVIIGFQKSDLTYINTAELRKTEDDPPPIIDDIILYINQITGIWLFIILIILKYG